MHIKRKEKCASVASVITVQLHFISYSTLSIAGALRKYLGGKKKKKRGVWVGGRIAMLSPQV